MPLRKTGKKVPSPDNLSDYTYGWDGMTSDMMERKMHPTVGWSTGQKGVCGTGSTPQAVAAMIGPFRKLLVRNEVRSFADVGAGDRIWIKDVNFNGIHYEAFDLIPRAPGVVQFDVTQNVLSRQFDVVMCRFVLNHLSAKLVCDAINNLRVSGSTFLLCTVPGRKPNRSSRPTIAQNQATYWTKHGIVLPKPADIIEDVNSWDLALFELNRITLP